MNRLYRRSSKKFRQKDTLFTANHFTDFHIKLLNSLYLDIRNQYIDELDDVMINLMYAIEENDKQNDNIYDIIMDIYDTVLIGDEEYQELLYNEYNNICNYCDYNKLTLHQYIAMMLYPDVNQYISSDRDTGKPKTKLLQIVDKKLPDLLYAYASKFEKECIIEINNTLKDTNDHISSCYIPFLKQSKYTRYITQFSTPLKTKISKELVKRKQNDILNRQHFLIIYSEQLFISHVDSVLEYILLGVFNKTLDFLNLYHNEQDICDIEETLSYNSIIEPKYIDKYLELNKIANDSGYNLIRCHGDHGIFENSQGYVVVIPQGRTIGKGLSIAIQKEILDKRN